MTQQTPAADVVETPVEETVTQTTPDTYESVEFADELNPDDYLIPEEEQDNAEEDAAEASGEAHPGEDDSTDSTEDEAEDAEDSEVEEEESEVDALRRRIEDMEAQAALKEIYAAVGGEEAYKAMAAKAVQVLPADAIAAYDSIVTTGTTAEAAFAVKALQAMLGPQHQEAEATFGGAAPAGTNHYADETALFEEMNDPRYGVDSAFTNRVTQKLANSPHIRF